MDVKVLKSSKMRQLTTTHTTENNAWSLTLTGDKSLTDHLTAKAELRLDFDKNNLSDDEGVAGEDVAALILAQLVYEF